LSLPPEGHQPVLLRETLDLLSPQSGEVFIDCTLGRGGHACAIAKLLGPTGLLIGLDADPRNLEFAAARLKSETNCPTRLFHANFAELPQVLDEVAPPRIDGILADLGVSTNQLFDEQYGLSFDGAAKLDMRLDPRIDRTAADWVNELPERELANVLYELAQERHSRRIARKIGEARTISPILTTDRLADIVRSAMPHGRGKGANPIDPATRTFLALRMAVNSEVVNLAALLEHGPRSLAPAGRMGVISFQSTEDRVVKQAFAALREAGLAELLAKKPVFASDQEIAANPRSRSARLRAIKKSGR
jgi:16S rRNA (cytosine1402-N4)-methyltransferase